MSEPVIPGGSIIIARKLIESEIWRKPPLYLKVWVYLLIKAQHKQYKGLRRGQLVTSIPEIMEDVSWTVGARIERPTKDQIFQIIEWLRRTSSKATLPGYESNAKATPKATMITTTKATQKILINISNYGDYQDLKNYESNGKKSIESNTEKATGEPASAHAPDNINKNVSTNKNDKNVKDKIYIDLPIDARYINIYNHFFKQKFGIDHMKVSEDRIEHIKSNIQQLYDYEVTEQDFTLAVEDHFNLLPVKNDGNILAFIRTFKRVFDIDYAE